MLTHRPMKDSDADIICGFAKSREALFFAFPKATYPLSTGMFMDICRQHFFSTVVLDDQTVVGFANFVKVRDKGVCAITNLIVHPNHRRKGAATYLVQVMLREAFGTYCARFVHAACFSHNQAAYQLFHGFGFKPAKMEQRLTSDGTPVLLVNLYLHRKKMKCKT